MTMPDQRVRAVNEAHRFVADLCDRSYRPSWTELRERARRVLKHHPSAHELSLILREGQHRDEAQRLADDDEMLRCESLSATNDTAATAAKEGPAP